MCGSKTRRLLVRVSLMQNVNLSILAHAGAQASCASPRVDGVRGVACPRHARIRALRRDEGLGFARPSRWGHRFRADNPRLRGWRTIRTTVFDRLHRPSPLRLAVSAVCIGLPIPPFASEVVKTDKRLPPFASATATLLGGYCRLHRHRYRRLLRLQMNRPAVHRRLHRLSPHRLPFNPVCIGLLRAADRNGQRKRRVTRTSLPKGVHPIMPRDSGWWKTN